MGKKSVIGISVIFILLFISILSFWVLTNKPLEDTNKLDAIVIAKTDESITVEDVNHIIYTMQIKDVDLMIGDNVAITYTGLLDKNNENQDVYVIDYNVVDADPTSINELWKDNGIFSKYYNLAYDKLKTLTLKEKIGQLFLIRYGDNGLDEIKKDKVSGFVFYEKDFKNKTKEEVQKMIDDLQKSSNIPLLTAVDEEGGVVVRVSKNPNLVSSPFKSSYSLYTEGGFNLIKEDTINKSKILHDLGLNLNLAPVVDVSTDPSDYIYERSFRQNTDLTSEYAATVIKASKGTGVSYTLKHFPGYADNGDTHLGPSTDIRTLDDIITNDLPPFDAGIKAGAEAILFSHNTVNSIDATLPVSLSISAHNLLRNTLGFTGIIITDDLDMGATKDIDQKAVKALLAGNDLIITTDYANDIKDVEDAINDGIISEEVIDKLAFRVLAWKYYKGLMINVK